MPGRIRVMLTLSEIPGTVNHYGIVRVRIYGGLPMNSYCEASAMRMERIGSDTAGIYLDTTVEGL